MAEERKFSTFENFPSGVPGDLNADEEAALNEFMD